MGKMQKKGVGMNCQCSSSCPSPPGLSSRSFTIGNELLNMSPTLSSYHSMPLERELHDEASICWDSDKGLGSISMNSVASSVTPTAKSTTELRKEIAILEVEIMHLENHLLSLYRTAFEERLPTQSNITRTPLHSKTVPSSPTSENRTSQKMEPFMQRSSSYYPYESSPARLSSTAMRSATSGHRSLVDYIGSSEIADAHNTPDRLSEEMVRCISSIYCKLADPSHTSSGLLASPTSSVSSSSIFSSHNPGDSWSPYCNEDPASNHRFQGFREENIERSGSTVEVVKICLDNNSYNYASTMLQNFRTMVSRLEKVDPSNLKREQKLSFWINIHNALVMHAYLAYGTHSRVKSSTILKAAYNVGGHCINACVIQSSILGIRPRNSAAWLQTLLSPRRRLKTGSTRHPYALEYPEPLVHFALCAGAYSDPLVRAYTAKTILQELKVARQEFIQANVFIHRQTKVLLPKLLAYFAKDSSLTMPELLELVTGCLPEVQQNAIRRCLRGRLDKYVHWLPQNQNFRYVIHGELANGIEAD